MGKLMLTARYIIPSPDEIINGGAIVINGAKIESVCKCYKPTRVKPEGEVVNLGNSVILPGFVNTHTHLELTSLHNSIRPRDDFTDWIEQLLKAKSRWVEQDFIDSLKKGGCKSLEAGTTTVADITRSGYSFHILKDMPIRKVVFEEIIGLNPQNTPSVINNAKDTLTNIKLDHLLNIGISPHAPYTVSRELYEECAILSQRLDIPICTHIAETKDEVRFLTEGQGLFVSFLKKYRMISSNWQPPGFTPIVFLERCGILKKKPLLVHCNYLTDNEISIIKGCGSSVVFCPRSHRFFNHEAHPFQRLMEDGINVALGTDSLASNESLSILDEMRFLYNNFPGMSPQSILSMATINGAKALGMGDKIGLLKADYEADIAVVRLPDGYGDDVYKGIFSADAENIFTMVSGSVCFDKLGLRQLSDV